MIKDELFILRITRIDTGIKIKVTIMIVKVEKYMCDFFQYQQMIDEAEFFMCILRFM